MKTLKLSSAVLLTLGLAACGATTQPAPSQVGANDLTPQRIICPEDPAEPCPTPTPTPPSVILSPNTRVLSNTVQWYDENSGLLVLTRTSATAAYAVGNIVVGGVTAATPVGVPPRRVTNVTLSGNTVTLSTQPAGLTEAVQQGSVAFTTTLTANDIAEETSPDLVYSALKGKSLLSALSVSCTKNSGNIYSKEFTKDLSPISKISGCARVGVDTTLNMNISRFTLQSFEASVTLSEEAQLELDLASASYSKEWELGRIRFNPITVMLGPVPIVFTPFIAFTVGVNGQVSGNITYKVTQDVSYKAGIQYRNGTLSKINQKTSNFNATIPALGGGPVTATAKGYLDVKPGLNFWSTVVLATADADVTGTVRGYVKADINTGRKPVWQITAGPQFCVGYKVKLDVLFGIISNSWSGNQCGNEMRAFEWHSPIGLGDQFPSPFPSWNNVTLDFTNVYGDIEIYKIDPVNGSENRVANLSGNNRFDLTPYIDGVQDTDFKIVSISKDPGFLSSYQRSIDMSAFGNNVLIWDAPARSCTSCHSGEVYTFTINKDLAVIQPH